MLYDTAQGQWLAEPARTSAHLWAVQTPPKPALSGAPAPQSVDPRYQPPDLRLVHALGPARCVRFGILPWRICGTVTVVLAPDGATLSRHAALLEEIFGPVRLALCPVDLQHAALNDIFGSELAVAAETRAPARFSCRNWSVPRTRTAALVCLAAVLAAAWLAPTLLLTSLLVWTALTMLASTALKAVAIAVDLRKRAVLPVAADPVPARLPVVSILVPLFKEREIAAHLLTRLDRLDYPRDRLDLCLILEQGDLLTRQTLEDAVLPPWAQVITVPKGGVQTKPRALNYALDFARGSIIGIYDAEDQPAPDQISRVVQRFAERGPDVACLQGVLDFYNTSRNWLSLCFTMEYAAWFRLVLPGLERLGLVLPLGGTTLFLRREAIEAVGGWDAHNVTEDAELGLRLARAGYRTEMIDSVTHEEANARAWPWVRQRSRWLKGYAMTWAVHMARPGELWRDLGPRRFWGVQALYLATLSQFVLAPLIWTFSVVPFGLWHPLAGVVPAWSLWLCVALFIVTELVNMAAAVIATRRSGRGWLGLSAPLLHLYFPLATLAVYKGLWEIVTRPFYWDKTAHGTFHHAPLARPPAIRPPEPLQRRA